MFGAVNGENPVHLHLADAQRRQFAFHAVGPKHDVGEALALQNLFVHFAVARVVAAGAAARIHQQLTGGLAGRRVKANGAALELEGAVDSVQCGAERELHLGLRGVHFERKILRGERRNQRQCAGRQKQERTKVLDHDVNICQPSASPLAAESKKESSPTCRASMRESRRGRAAKARRYAAAQAAMTVEQEHQIGHQFRAPAHSPVRGLVDARDRPPPARRRAPRLLKQQAQTFAGDGIHRSRGIAYQRHIAAPDAAQAA